MCIVLACIGYRYKKLRYSIIIKEIRRFLPHRHVLLGAAFEVAPCERDSSTAVSEVRTALVSVRAGLTFRATATPLTLVPAVVETTDSDADVKRTFPSSLDMKPCLTELPSVATSFRLPVFVLFPLSTPSTSRPADAVFDADDDATTDPPAVELCLIRSVCNTPAVSLSLALNPFSKTNLAKGVFCRFFPAPAECTFGVLGLCPCDKGEGSTGRCAVQGDVGRGTDKLEGLMGSDWIVGFSGDEEEVDPLDSSDGEEGR